MNKRLRLLLCLLTAVLLCGCRASIIEGTEFTVRGVVTDTSYATVEEKSYGILEKAYPRTLVKTEDGETYGFFEMRGYDLATAFPGDTVEIRGGTDKRSGLTIAVEITVLEMGEWHQNRESQNAAQSADS